MKNVSSKREKCIKDVVIKNTFPMNKNTWLALVTGCYACENMKIGY